ncbi:MAG: NUDIX domain-containing protein, partial [Candidatus Kariarchaeaceae archaeon]
MEAFEKTVDATLCFILHENEVLLIMKKRGFGKGKLNGPGGKARLNETIVEAAIRETREETGLKPLNPLKKGTLDFYF